MNRWINVSSTVYQELLVHEVKCPVCGYKETFHIKPHSSCYVCDTELIYEKEKDNEQS